MTRLRIASLALFVLVVAAACGDGDGDSESASGTTGQPRSTTTQAQEPNRCVTVPSALVAAIEEGLTVSGGGTLRNARAVKSNDFEKVYMVAADIQGAGMEGNEQVGVWATNSLKGDGLIFSVDGQAKEFSDWGDGATTDANITQAADGVDEARECARNA